MPWSHRYFITCSRIAPCMHVMLNKSILSSVRHKHQFCSENTVWMSNTNFEESKDNRSIIIWQVKPFETKLLANYIHCLRLRKSWKSNTTRSTKIETKELKQSLLYLLYHSLFRGDTFFLLRCTLARTVACSSLSLPSLSWGLSWSDSSVNMPADFCTWNCCIILCAVRTVFFPGRFLMPEWPFWRIAFDAIGICKNKRRIRCRNQQHWASWGIYLIAASRVLLASGLASENAQRRYEQMRKILPINKIIRE